MHEIIEQYFVISRIKKSTHVFAAWAHLPHSKELEQDEVETMLYISYNHVTK